MLATLRVYDLSSQLCTNKDILFSEFTKYRLLNLFLIEKRYVTIMTKVISFCCIACLTNFYPHRCNNKSIGLPKLKFLLIFYENSEYKRFAVA